MQRIDELKTVPIIGETYLIPCFVLEQFGYDQKYVRNNKPSITPVYNNPHHDIENNQHEIHYHVDYRFEHDDNWKLHNIVYGGGRVFKSVIALGITYIPLVYATHYERGVTPNKMISNSGIKVGCKIKNNLCPHRGFDLSQVPEDENGDKHCPLHGTVVRKGIVIQQAQHED